MKVLFCTLNYPPGAAGGAEQQARLQAEELVRRGHDVHVVCPRVQSQSSGALNGVRVSRLPIVDRRPFRTITYLPILFAYVLLNARKYQVVHVHLANVQADVAVLAARMRRVPTYVKLAAGGPRGEIGRMKKVAFVTQFFGIRHADAVQAISNEIAADALAIGVDPRRIHRIPNGVAASSAIPSVSDRSEARARLGLSGSDTVVLYLGRLEREKGVADLIAVWDEIGDQPFPSLLLVGSLGLHQPVDVGLLPPKVSRREWTGDVASYLTAADIFALPSYVEGMSNAMLEAMGRGLPVIAARSGAADELIDNTRGILLEPGDRLGLAVAIGELAADPSLRQRLGENGRAFVAHHFSTSSVVDRIEATYSSIMGAQ
jgi:glycosyltransferase involved in cell wall biosynthesis